MPLFGGKPNIEKMKTKRDVNGLIKALAHKDASIRVKAAEALGEIGDSQAIEPLIAAFQDNEGRVCRAAVLALGQVGGNSVVEQILAALKDNEGILREAAAIALGQISDARAVEPLIAALDDREYSVCEAAAEALGKLKDTRAVKPLCTLVRKTNSPDRRHQDTCRAAVVALGWIGDKQAVQLLGDLVLRDMRVEVRRAAAVALGKIGNEEAAYKLKLVIEDNEGDGSTRLFAIEALGDIGYGMAVAPLINILRLDSTPAIRREAAYALGKIGDPEAHNALKHAMNDADNSVREAAEKAIDQLR